MPPRPLVVLGMLGPTLDQGRGETRWDRWRPTVAVCQHPDLPVSRLDLLHQPRFSDLAERVRSDLQAVAPSTHVVLHPVSIADPWDFEEVYGTLHDFASSYPFAPEQEDYLVHITTGTHVAQICMFLLTESRDLPGRLLQTAPPRRLGPAGEAQAKLSGPGTHAIIDLDLSKYDRLASRFRDRKLQDLSFLKSGIDTQNAAYNRLIERIEHVAIASRAPILLTGPTGAGKSRLARRIHELKRTRRQIQGDLVDVNCATLRGDQAMSALFGHVKGAFTGALADRPGLLKKAHGGLLFLDEIGELGADEQAMLLRALEDKTFLPVGSDKEVRSDFLLVAGTNRDLAADSRAGRFRHDLFARINLWTFRLPGLAERPEDIVPNLAYELDEASRALGVRVTLSREAREKLLAFATSPGADWLGNFRDFSGAVTRMATLAPGGRITAEIVSEEIERLREGWAALRPPLEKAADEGVLQSTLGAAGVADLDPFDRVQLAEVLRVARGARSLSEAGRALFAVSRGKKTSVNDTDRLRKYLARFGLGWDARLKRVDRLLVEDEGLDVERE